MLNEQPWQIPILSIIYKWACLKKSCLAAPYFIYVSQAKYIETARRLSYNHYDININCKGELKDRGKGFCGLSDKYGEDFNWHMGPASNKSFVEELKREGMEVVT